MNKIPRIQKLIQDSHGVEKAKKLVPFFYYFLFFIAFQKLEGLNYTISQGQRGFLPRLPIFWADYFNYSTTTTLIIIFFVFSTLAGAYFYRNRIGRIFALLGILQYHAFLNSFGGPQHQLDHWLWVALILVFLPDIWGKKSHSSEGHKKFLVVFWGVQAFLLLTYSMSGIGKLHGAIEQYLQGQAHAFSFDVAALHITSLLTVMQETTILGPLIVNYPVLGWLPFLAVIYLEFFSFLVAFRPSLHKIWALALILFHIGTYLAMRAIFVAPSALLLIFFFNSPFRETGTQWRESLSDLPLARLLKRILNLLHLRQFSDR